MEVCRLCLDLVATQGDAKPLDGETRDMVQVVAPELNLEASKNPSVCSECQKTLSRLFDFKSRVFEHEGEIREKVGDRRGTVSLKAAVTGEADPPLDPDRDKAKDRLCRTCLAPIECESFTVLRPSEPDAYLSSMLDMCLVEVDLALTKDPVMCEGCLDNLQKLHHFKSSCQDVEDKIVDYCNKNKLKESTVVDLHAVLESERPRDIEMLTVKDEDGASGSKIKDEEKEVEPKSEDEDEEMSEDEEEDEEMSEDEEVKQEELDIKSETEPGTSDSDKERSNHDIKEENIRSGMKAEMNEKIIHEAEPLFNCNLCSDQFKSKGKLILHKKNEHGLNVEYFQCSKCEYKSTIKASLTRHIQAVHEGVAHSKCDLCSAQFKAYSTLKLHKKNEHGLNVDYFHCSKCEYKSIRNNSLTKHIKAVHTGVARALKIEYYQCSKCKYKSIRKDNLSKHIKSVHEGVAHFNCNLCSAQFKSSNPLKLHKKNEHGLEVGYYPCSKCEYKSIRKDDLSRHIKSVHEGVGRFNCNLCSAQFKSKGNLILHKKTEHDTSVKYFHCSKCEYKGILKSNLTRHLKVVHEGIKAHSKCNLCSAQFRARNTLKLHQKNEHGLNVEYFQCSKCEYKSIRKYDLSKHIKSVHEGVSATICAPPNSN